MQAIIALPEKFIDSTGKSSEHSVFQNLTNIYLGNDFPLNNLFPTREHLKKMPLDRVIKLRGIAVTTHTDFGNERITGLRLLFTNGVESQCFGREEQDDDKAVVSEIPIDSAIRQISIKVGYGAIQGIRLIDGKGKYIIDQTYCPFGVWNTQEIPEGMEIIGAQCLLGKLTSITTYSYIKWIGFLLWKPNPNAI